MKSDPEVRTSAERNRSSRNQAIVRQAHLGNVWRQFNEGLDIGRRFAELPHLTPMDSPMLLRPQIMEILEAPGFGADHGFDESGHRLQLDDLAAYEANDGYILRRMSVRNLAEFADVATWSRAGWDREWIKSREITEFQVAHMHSTLVGNIAFVVLHSMNTNYAPYTRVQAGYRAILDEYRNGGGVVVDPKAVPHAP